MTHCHRHAPAIVAHPSGTACPLCVSEESASLARTQADLAERKVRRLEHHLREADRVRALPSARLYPPIKRGA